MVAGGAARLEDTRNISTDPTRRGCASRDCGRWIPRVSDWRRLLAAWRERRAIERNRPRGWILDDAALRDIVMQVPRSLEALAALPEFPAGVLKHCGAELLECIRAAAVPDPPPPINARMRPDPARTALVKKLGALNQTLAADLGLSPGSVGDATRSRAAGRRAPRRWSATWLAARSCRRADAGRAVN